MDAILLHVGHAKDEVEVALTVVGFVVTVAGLGVAVMSLWPRRRREPRPERSGRAARRRALHQDEVRLLDEDVD